MMTRPLLLMSAVGAGVGTSGVAVLARPHAFARSGTRILGVMLAMLGATFLVFAFSYASVGSAG